MSVALRNHKAARMGHASLRVIPASGRTDITDGKLLGSRAPGKAGQQGTNKKWFHQEEVTSLCFNMQLMAYFWQSRCHLQ